MTASDDPNGSGMRNEYTVNDKYHVEVVIAPDVSAATVFVHPIVKTNPDSLRKLDDVQHSPNGAHSSVEDQNSPV